MGKTLVLLAEDDSDARSLMDEYLRHLGFRVEAVSDGLRMVERSVELSSTSQSHIIVTDIEMGGYDGVEAIELLHHRGILPPTVFITGVAEPEVIDRARRLAAGLFRKPLDLRALTNLLDTL